MWFIAVRMIMHFLVVNCVHFHFAPTALEWCEAQNTFSRTTSFDLTFWSFDYLGPDSKV